MKPFDVDKLKVEFWDGRTSLNEEAKLKRNIEADSVEATYFDALQKEHLSLKNIDESSWEFIQLKRRKRRLQHFSIAASVAIIIGIVGLNIQNQHKAKIEKQFAILEQTINHISSELTTTHKTNIIYQDEYIVIVADN